ncbi:MAG: MFS transporter [Candidatus Hodarchaeales archaeon]|jgi:MFS family permease
MVILYRSELVYLLYHLPVAMSSPFIAWYFFNLSSGDYWGAGLIVSIPYLFFIFSTALFGRLSDFLGSKKVIILALLSQLTSFVVYFNISEPWVFFFIYIFFNVLISAFSPAYNRYVSFSRDIDQGEVFGRLASWASVGFFLGSVLTALLLGNNGEDFRPLFLVAAVFSSLALISALFLTTELKSESEISPRSSKVKIPSLTTLKSTLQPILKPIIVMLTLVLLTQTTNALYVGLFAIFIENELEQSVNWLAIINSTATIIGIGVTFLVGKLIVRKFPKKHLINIGLCVYLLLPLLTFLFSNEPLLVFSLYSIPTYAIFFVVAPVIISENTLEEHRGFSMGLYSAFMFCGQAIGTLIGAYIASITGIIRYNFAISAVLALIAIFIGFFFYKDYNSTDD